MRHAKTPLTLFAATLMVSLVAGCAEPSHQAAAPLHNAATSGPELAGAWYQVYFDTSSAELNARGKMITATVAKVAADEPTTRVTVIGKTDRIGAAPANLALSERRATAVRDALIAAGVPAARINTSWTGEARTAVGRPDDATEAHNRVVDVTVVRQPQ